jgi:hypothetical protein
MTTSSAHVTQYGVHRLTVDIESTPKEFRTRYEQAVPALPWEEVNQLVRRQAPWQEMINLLEAASPSGFFIYFEIDVDSVMRLAGDQASCKAYLMGNHIIAERMFRHEPAVMLYVPLHTTIWGPVAGPAHFTFDQPSDQIGSFGVPEVKAVGVELDRKLAALLAHLEIRTPDALLSS